MVLICAICHDESYDLADLLATRCGHVFHSRCVLTWLQQSKTCPQCRRCIEVDNIMPLYPTTSDHSPNEDQAAYQAAYLKATVPEIKKLTVAVALKDKEIFSLNRKVKRLRDNLQSVQQSSGMIDFNQMQQQVEYCQYKANLADILLAQSKMENNHLKISLHVVQQELLEEKNQSKISLNAVKQELLEKKKQSIELRANFECMKEKLLCSEKIIKTLKSQHASLEELEVAAASSLNDAKSSFHSLINAESAPLNVQIPKVASSVAHTLKTVTGESTKAAPATVAKPPAPPQPAIVMSARAKRAAARSARRDAAQQNEPIK